MQEINNAKISMSLGREQKREMSPRLPPWVRQRADSWVRCPGATQSKGSGELLSFGVWQPWEKQV